LTRQCLGVAVFSYIGKVCLGANADWDRVPDLHRFLVMHPDVVILDLPMSELDGGEVCRHLRADTRTVSVPVVLLTARDTKESVAHTVRDGTDECVVKPVRREDLIACVSRILERAYGKPAAPRAAAGGRRAAARRERAAAA